MSELTQGEMEILEGVFSERLLAWRALPLTVREKADKVLRDRLPLDQLVEMIEADPVHWYAPIHFHGGMNIRNLLRTEGEMKDEILPPNVYSGGRNWDDYYIPCVGVACRTGVWGLLSEAERKMIGGPCYEMDTALSRLSREVRKTWLWRFLERCVRGLDRLERRGR